MALQYQAQRSFKATRRSLETTCKGSGFALARTALVALALSACGGAGGTGDAVDLETRSDNLFAFGQPEVFKYISALPTLSTGTGDGAMCTPDGGTHSKIIFTRDTSNFIQGIAASSVPRVRGASMAAQAPLGSSAAAPHAAS